MNATRTSAIVAQEPQAAECMLRDGTTTVAVYSAVEAEYRSVRERVGLQDLNHYGKISVSGAGAQDLVNHLVFTDLARLPIHQLQASFLLDEQGKPVCDLLIANLGDHYLLLSEGAAPAEVASRLNAAAPAFGDVVVNDRTDAFSLVSVDGPYSWELLKTFLGLSIVGTRYLEIVPNQSIGGVDTTLCRAGKTGEYGYLLLCAADQGVALWSALKQAGTRFEMLPVGTRAADRFKLENRVFSPHHEGTAVDSVLELNTRAMFGRDKGEHVGREALLATMENGLARRVVGMAFDQDLPPDAAEVAAGLPVHFGERLVGQLVNTGYSYSLSRWIALALIEEEYACVGIDYDVRAPRATLAASTVSAPFLFNRSMKIRPQEDTYFA